MKKDGNHIDKNLHKELTHEEMQKYLSGELSPKKMHEFEKIALDSEFYTDAIEGLESIDSEMGKSDLGALSNRLQDRLSEKKKNPVPVWFRYAAAIAVLAIGTFSVINIFDFNTNKSSNLAKQEAAPSEDAFEDAEKGNTIADSTLLSDNTLALNQPTEKEEIKALQKKPEPVTQAYKKKMDEMPDVIQADEINADIVIEEMEDLKEFAEIVAEEDAPLEAPLAMESASAEQPIPEGNSIEGNDKSGKEAYFYDNDAVELKKEDDAALLEYNEELNSRARNAKRKRSFVRRDQYAKSEAPSDAEIAETTPPKKLVVIEAIENASNTPAPVGGIESLNSYIKQNLQYPDEARTNNIEGWVKISFMVGADGELSDFKVIEKLGYGCDEEAIRLIKSRPSWESGNTSEKVLVSILFQFD